MLTKDCVSEAPILAKDWSEKLAGYKMIPAAFSKRRTSTMYAALATENNGAG
jgi:hypothetical protein